MAAAGEEAEPTSEQSPPTRPALAALQHDQAALFDPEQGAADDYVQFGLRDGVPTRRRAIEWYQRATVRTLGHITDEWPARSLARDAMLVTALVTGETRERWAREPLPLEGARRYRRVLLCPRLLSACNRAYRELRKGAGEYIDDSGEDGPQWSDLDPEAQTNVAMRPGFQELDRRQRQSLEDLWGGFESRADLEDWLHGLNEATNGEIASDLAGRITGDPVALEMLLAGAGDAGLSRIYRERLAIVTLLPAFADGVQSVDSGELAQTKRTGGTFNFD